MGAFAMFRNWLADKADVDEWDMWAVLIRVLKNPRILEEDFKRQVAA
jgi:hypothetical protein